MKKLLVVILLSLSMHAWPAMVIETIQLQHRPANEIIPIVEPMLAPQASVTGTGYKLIIKSTPDNINEIQAMLEEIDINQNQLKVYVSLGRQTESSRSGQSVRVEANSDIGSVEAGSAPIEDDSGVSIANDKTKFDARIYESRSRNQTPVVQVMSVTEGYWAKISMGQSIPTATRTRNSDGTVTESVTYQTVMTGYEVMPRTHNDTVTLTIKPLRQSASTDGSIETTELESTVTGKLGEWIFLGGTDHAENLQNSGITYRTRVRSTDVNQIWVKVERP